MLRGILVPREMVNEALVTTYRKLQAHETKFFSFKGRVTEERRVEDHATQLAAADQIFSLAGLYSREREQGPSTPGVALEVDPVTGVVRIIVGSPISAALEESIQTIELPPSLPSPAESPVVLARCDGDSNDVDREGGSISDAAWRVISDEIVE